MTDSIINVRHAKASDSKALLILMKKLAEFEDYLDEFIVTEEDLLAHGFPAIGTHKQATFTAIVAEHQSKHHSKLVGYLVYYEIPFTYDLKPTLFIKEFFIDKSSRAKGIGKQLMKLAISDAKKNGCGRMKWDVLSDNINAQSFYQSFGASYDTRWQGYVLEVY